MMETPSESNGVTVGGCEVSNIRCHVINNKHIVQMYG